MKRNFLSKVFQASLMCCLAVLFTACDDMFATEDNPTSAYLGMSDKPVTIKVGETFQRQATSASTAVIEYTSSDTKIATVDNTGLVTAIAEGEATITATATGYSSQTGKKIYLPDSKSYKLTVKPATLPAATITTAPVATTGDIIAGSATALVVAGVADGGTMMYQVTTTNTKPTTTEGFNATVPTAETLAAGTCYVWYYAKADAQHADSEIAGPVAVTLINGYAANEYNEGSWDSTNKKVVFTKQTAASVTAMTNTTTIWSAGWYTVSGNVTITGDVTLLTNVHLILQDGATLTINGQLDCETNGKNLYIYGQKKGDGKLNVNDTNTGIAISSDSGYRIEIHGGEVTAEATGNFGLYTGYLAVYGGKFTATSGSRDGIGFENTIDVYGGEVVATSNATSSSSARYGIISGGQNTQILKVYGGKVTATGNGKYDAPDYGSGFGCYVWSATTGIRFYFSDDGTTWGSGFSYNIGNSVGLSSSSADTKKRYAKAE